MATQGQWLGDWPGEWFGAGDAGGAHPVGPLTHGRAFGAFSGGRYGSFAGKGGAAGAHPVGRITQAQAFGPHSGRRYGSFAGKGTASAHPVGRITQALAFGAHSGRRYGSFTGRAESEVPPEDVGGGFRRPHKRSGTRKRRLDDVQDRPSDVGQSRPTSSERAAPVGDMALHAAHSVLRQIEAKPRGTQRARDALEELRQALQAAEALADAADRKRLNNRLRAAVLVALLLMN